MSFVEGQLENPAYDQQHSLQIRDLAGGFDRNVCISLCGISREDLKVRYDCTWFHHSGRDRRYFARIDRIQRGHQERKTGTRQYWGHTFDCGLSAMSSLILRTQILCKRCSHLISCRRCPAVSAAFPSLRLECFEKEKALSHLPVRDQRVCNHMKEAGVCQSSPDPSLLHQQTTHIKVCPS